MLSKLVRTALWLLLHAVYIIIDRVSVLCIYIHIKSIELFNARGIKNSFDYVSFSLKNVSKIPHHVVLILDDDTLSYTDLSKLVIWSLAAGVSYFTFYDYSEKLSKNEERLFKAVQEMKTHIPGYIKWKEQPELNGFVSGTSNKITVNFISISDGRQKIVSVVKNICSDVAKGSLTMDKLDLNYLDKCISDVSSALPEPNLAIYCSSVCRTNGLLPWHIRLTEFLHLGDRRFINEARFVSLLKKYGRCEQRLGT